LIDNGVRVTYDVVYPCANFGLPICLSVLDLCLMYATDRRQTADVRHKHRLMPPRYGGGGIITALIAVFTVKTNTLLAEFHNNRCYRNNKLSYQSICISSLFHTGSPNC